MLLQLTGKTVCIFSEDGALTTALEEGFATEGAVTTREQPGNVFNLKADADSPDVVVIKDFVGVSEAIKALRTGGSLINITTAIDRMSRQSLKEHDLLRQAATLGAERGLRVNGVAIGVIESEAGPDVLELAGEKILERILLKRFGKAEEAAQAVLFLAGASSNYITGETLHVDGGVGRSNQPSQHNFIN